MFTGIIETLGQLESSEVSGDNRILSIRSSITPELKVDQSLSHNGACLTVTGLISDRLYQVVAVPETLERTNLGAIKAGDRLNLERSMILGGRLDGHLVQGHVDQTAVCNSIVEVNGSWEFEFLFTTGPNHRLIEKGSICVNGVSLTCYNLKKDTFQVSIIPYTYENTNFQDLETGDPVNIEFDMVGKYIQGLIMDRG